MPAILCGQCLATPSLSQLRREVGAGSAQVDSELCSRADAQLYPLATNRPTQEATPHLRYRPDPLGVPVLTFSEYASLANRQLPSMQPPTASTPSSCPQHAGPWTTASLRRLGQPRYRHRRQGFAIRYDAVNGLFGLAYGDGKTSNSAPWLPGAWSAPPPSSPRPSDRSVASPSMTTGRLHLYVVTSPR